MQLSNFFQFQDWFCSCKNLLKLLNSLSNYDIYKFTTKYKSKGWNYIKVVGCCWWELCWHWRITWVEKEHGCHPVQGFYWFKQLFPIMRSHFQLSIILPYRLLVSNGCILWFTTNIKSWRVFWSNNRSGSGIYRKGNKFFFVQVYTKHEIQENRLKWMENLVTTCCKN